MRHDSNLLLGARAALDEESLSGVRHDDHELRLLAELGQDFELMLGRLREHGVERDDERLCQRLRERQHVLAVEAAEDAVLVLEEHDVDIEPAEHARGADVVAADRLPDRREERAPLWAGRLVQDRDDVDALDVVDAEERPSQVSREGADAAGARRKCGDDRCPHRR